MHWHRNQLRELARSTPGYGDGEAPSSEPAALTALALLGHGRTAEAGSPLQWLVETQLPSGQVPVRRDPPRPAWTTSLASLAWTAARQAGLPGFVEPLDRAAAWMLSAAGESSPPRPMFGHDPQIVGWAWAEDTHSWLEPTALHVLALSARGWNRHPRTIEGRRLIRNRLLPGGGCNYGNTVVLGQTLRPHIQPSGLAMLALAGQTEEAATAPTLDYLRQAVGSATATASLCWALMGLAAHDQLPVAAATWLARAALRPRLTSHLRALILLAALGRDNPLIRLPAEANP